jgi:alkylhydroperoxidase family enzyme
VSDGTSPRLPPLPLDRWGDAERDALESGFPGASERLLSGGDDAPPVPNVLGTLMHHPALAGPFLRYNQVLLQTPRLGHRLRELLILRVASRTGSSYEWAQHVRIAKTVDVSAEEIDALRGDDRGTGWAGLEADALTAADELIDHHEISDGTWARLADQLDDAQLVELVFVVGTYAALAMAFNSFRLQLDPGLPSG